MTSIERTAYPQFRRLTSARVLHVFFTPSEDEAAWARERTETPESLLALLVDLKCFQRMARFCSREEIPHAVTDHVRHCLGLAPETEADHGAARTMRLHRSQVRKRQGATRDPRRARALAEAAIREAARPGECDRPAPGRGGSRGPGGCGPAVARDWPPCRDLGARPAWLALVPTSFGDHRRSGRSAA